MDKTDKFCTAAAACVVPALELIERGYILTASVLCGAMVMCTIAAICAAIKEK